MKNKFALFTLLTLFLSGSYNMIAQESDIHIDSSEIVMDNLLYYVNDSDGDTILYENDRKTVIKRISPKAGRFVYFSGDIPHCASRPSENLKRMVININVSKE